MSSNKTLIQTAAGAAAQPKQQTPGAMMQHVFENAKMRELFENTLKRNADTFIGGVIDLYASDTYLQQCNPNLVALECLKAATLNLPINKQLGFAYVVPYKKNGQQIPQFQLGYKGYIQLAQRTGAYRFINADVVYEGELSGRDKLTGMIGLEGERIGDKVVGYFAYIETINGFKKALYMSSEEVIAWAKRYSKSYDSSSSAWASNFDEMAIKTCLRRLISKWGVMSVEMVEAYKAEDVAELADQQIGADEADPIIFADVVDVDVTDVPDALGCGMGADA